MHHLLLRHHRGATCLFWILAADSLMMCMHCGASSGGGCKNQKETAIPLDDTSQCMGQRAPQGLLGIPGVCRQCIHHCCLDKSRKKCWEGYPKNALNKKIKIFQSLERRVVRSETTESGWGRCHFPHSGQRHKVPQKSTPILVILSCTSLQQPIDPPPLNSRSVAATIDSSAT